MDDERCNELRRAAWALLAKLERMTSEEFAHGGESAERERLAEVLTGITNDELLPTGSPVWFWLQDQAGDGWVPATITGHSGKDGWHVYDVLTEAGWVRWGWLWQVRFRRMGDQVPADQPGALRGEAGPWP